MFLSNWHMKRRSSYQWWTFLFGIINENRLSIRVTSQISILQIFSKMTERLFVYT